MFGITLAFRIAPLPAPLGSQRRQAAYRRAVRVVSVGMARP
jgi:hypothetical protein